MTLDELMMLLSKWDNLGKYVRPSGTVRYGGLSAQRSLGSSHMIYCPLEDMALKKFVSDRQYLKQYCYPKSLSKFNGAELFRGALGLEGLHLGLGMDTLDMPFNMINTNFGDQDLAKKFNGLIVGGANFGRRSFYYIEDSSTKILAVDRSSESIVHDWRDFDTFLRSEIARLNAIFLDDGKPPDNVEYITYK